MAGLLALLFGGFEISVQAEYNDEGHEKPKFDSYLQLATKELQEAEAEFDYFTFAQRWPGTYCKQPGACCQNVAEPAIFTVNGFWPDNYDGSYPTCCSGPAFEQNDLGYVVEVLQHYWPRVSCSSPMQCNGNEAGSLWQQEWEKHGTCVAPIIQSARTYFELALHLLFKYDMAQILKAAGIVPDSSQQYDTNKMISAVQAAVGASPRFTCKGNQIYEIRICYTKELQLRDCLPKAASCPSTLLIPPFEA